MWTVFATVTTGVTILVLGRLVQTFMLDPLNEQRKVIGEIDYNLTYLAQWYGNPWSPEKAKELPEHAMEAIRQASDRLRHCGSLLWSTTNAIAGYDWLERSGCVLPRAAINEAGSMLIGLSNAFFLSPESAAHQRNSDVASKIRQALRLDQVRR
jgi:hypothetical protein